MRVHSMKLGAWLALAAVVLSVGAVSYRIGVGSVASMPAGEADKNSILVHVWFDPVLSLPDSGFALGIQLERDGTLGNRQTFFVPPGDRHSVWSPDRSQMLMSFEVAQATPLSGS